MSKEMERYMDMIDMPHHVSANRRHMPMEERAAQFAPFAALTGYSDVIEQTARLTSAQNEAAGNQNVPFEEFMAEFVFESQE